MKLNVEKVIIQNTPSELNCICTIWVNIFEHLHYRYSMISLTKKKKTVTKKSFR